jgi:hypothetical protein
MNEGMNVNPNAGYYVGPNQDPNAGVAPQYTAPQYAQYAAAPGVPPMYGNPFYGNAGWNQAPVNTTSVYPMNSSLSKAEQEALTRDHGAAFFTPPTTKIEIAKHVCNHHYTDGRFALRDNNDGTQTCRICGATFKYIDPATAKPEEIKHIIDDFRNLWETIKFNYGAITPEIAKNLYAFGAVLSQSENMWKCASDYVANVGLNDQNQYGQGNGYSMYNMVDSIYRGGPVGYGVGAPVYSPAPGAYYGAPAAPAAPTAWPPTGYAAPAASAPVGYPTAPAAPANPYGAGYGYAPQPQAQAPTGWGQAPASYAAPVATAPAAPNTGVLNANMPNPIGTPVASVPPQASEVQKGVSVSIPGTENFKA